MMNAEKKELTREQLHYLNDMDKFTLESFWDTLTKNGWNMEDSTEYRAIASLYKEFSLKRAKCKKYPDRSNSLLSIMQEFIDTDTTKCDLPRTAKYLLLQSGYWKMSYHYDRPEDEDYAGVYDYLYESNKYDEMNLEIFPQEKEKFIDKCLHYHSHWQEFSDTELLSTLYDGLKGKNGNYYENLLIHLKHLVTYGSYSEEFIVDDEDEGLEIREELIRRIKRSLEEIPVKERSMEQNLAISSAVRELEVHIPMMRKKNDSADGALRIEFVDDYTYIKAGA